MELGLEEAANSLDEASPLSPGRGLSAAEVKQRLAQLTEQMHMTRSDQTNLKSNFEQKLVMKPVHCVCVVCAVVVDCCSDLSLLTVPSYCSWEGLSQSLISCCYNISICLSIDCFQCLSR